MKEMVLLYNMPDREQRLKLEMLLFPLHIRLRTVKKEEYLHPLGFFIGNDNISPATEAYTGPELPDTMLIFANIPEATLNTFLAGLRRNKIGPIAHKAVLTPTNQHWNALECYQEIDAEHKAMNHDN